MRHAVVVGMVVLLFSVGGIVGAGLLPQWVSIPMCACVGVLAGSVLESKVG